jgi:hypothetical protein
MPWQRTRTFQPGLIRILINYNIAMYIRAKTAKTVK